ncbi:hypothetical protein ES703_100429 [subsurface metagenome]
MSLYAELAYSSKTTVKGKFFFTPQHLTRFLNHGKLQRMRLKDTEDLALSESYFERI